MKIRKEYLQKAEADKVLSPGGAEKLWEHLSIQVSEEPTFKAQHALYYFGAMLMILPFSIFISAGMINLGNFGLLLIALAIGSATFYFSQKLFNNGRRIAAGVFATVSLTMVPLGIYSILAIMGLNPFDSSINNYGDFHRKISFSFILLELLSLATSIAYLRHFKLPFLMLPPSVILWYLGMDLTSTIVGGGMGVTYKGWSIFYGLLMLSIAYAVDKRTKNTLSDFSFWLWIFGTVSFWLALSLTNSGSVLGKHIYALINLAMIIASIVVSRRVLAVAGGFGLTGYLGYLSMDLFRDALFFPFFCLILGGLLVWAGLKWPKFEALIAEKLGINRK